MSNSLVLDQLNQQAGKVQRALAPHVEKPKPKKKKWWQYLLNGLLGVVSIVAEVAATALMGPVGGMVVGVVADIGTNIAGDYIMDENPWETQNIIFNVILPVCTIPGKAASISKITKNSVNVIGEAADDIKLQKLAKRLNDLDIDDQFATTGKRAYQQALKEFDIDPRYIKQLDFTDDAFYLKQLDDAKWKKVRSVEKGIRSANKVLSFIADPNYAQKSLFKWASKVTKFDKVINKANKQIKIFKKRIHADFLKKQKRLKDVLIPLNHTKAPWIAGIKLQPAASNAIHYYHVIIIFDRALTNGKKPVVLYNKAWRYIYKFISAPSAGQYYINNISWGWNIGKMIRNNQGLLTLFKFSTHNFASQYGQIAYASAKLVTKAADLIDELVNGTYAQKVKQAWNPANVVMNAYTQTIGKLPGAQIGNKIVRTVQSGKITYTSKYVKQQAKKLIHKYRDEHYKQGIHKGYIGYGKYKYKLN